MAFEELKNALAGAIMDLKPATIPDNPIEYEYVTPEFVQMLLRQPNPTDIEIENKMTPFFGVNLGDRFQSCHYGTELYL